MRSQRPEAGQVPAGTGPRGSRRARPRCGSTRYTRTPSSNQSPLEAGEGSTDLGSFRSRFCVIARPALSPSVPAADSSRSREMAAFQPLFFIIINCLLPANTCCLSCCFGNSLPFAQAPRFPLLNRVCCLAEHQKSGSCVLRA